ncbi:hypothetical protein SRHO_G00321360 [Serrasalmus rhombeus]
MAADVGSMFQYWKKFDLRRLQVSLSRSAHCGKTRAAQTVRASAPQTRALRGGCVSRASPGRFARGSRSFIVLVAVHTANVLILIGSRFVLLVEISGVCRGYSGAGRNGSVGTLRQRVESVSKSYEATAVSSMSR